MRVRACWHGRVPEPGDFIASVRRPRYAYCILSVRPLRPETATYSFEVERIRYADLPGGAVVHAWRWDSRGSRRSHGS